MNQAITSEERFNEAFKVLIGHENGYSNNPKDPGGPTKYGITQKDINQHWAALNLPKDIRNLSLNKAKEFYKKLWWDNYHYNAINSLNVAIKIFDMAVNIGDKAAHKIVQESCNHCAYNLTVDGILGGKTLGALNEISLHGREEDLMMDLCENQKDFYETLIGQHPNLKVFEKGWLNRAAWDGL